MATGSVTLSFQQSLSDIGSASVSVQQAVADSGSVALSIQQTVADTGSASLAIEQTVSALGSAVLGFKQTLSDTGNASLFFNQSLADTGVAHAGLTQTVGELAGVSIAIAQTVGHSAGSASLALSQSIAQRGNVGLTMAQNVYDPDFVAAGWTGWDIVVTVDGGDASADLVDTVTIEAERSSARIARFTLAMSGSIAPSQWVGKSVAIDYLQNNGAAWRRFSGVIERAEYDVADKTLRCLCTDDLQRAIDSHSRAQLDALIGGHWSDSLYNESHQGWDYARDLLKTTFKSLHYDSDRRLIVAGMNNAAVADHSYTTDDILDDLSVDLAQRNDLVNRVDITFQARYSRLHHAERAIFWHYDATFCEQLAQPPLYPDRSLVGEAIENGGWQLLSANYESLWPSGIYNCFGRPVAYSNGYPDGIRGFSAKAARRWRQTVTDVYALTVQADDSIDLHGALADAVSASVSVDTGYPDWGGPDDDYAALPDGIINDGQGHYRLDDIDGTDIASALNALINEAATTILTSHQQNRVRFSLPLAPYIELGQTVGLSDADVTCKGIVHRFVETYDFNTGAPVTAMELAVSRGGSGLDIASPALSAPPRPGFSGEATGVAGGITLTTHLGGYAVSPPENPNWTGAFLNADTPTPGAPTYTAGLKIPFAEISGDHTDSIEQTLPLTYRLAVPDNLLTITA